MEAADFARIETSLSIELPDAYRLFMSSYPSEADEDIRSHALFSDSDLIVAENLEHRKEGWFGIKWPDEYFVIGDDGCGDTYFMVLGKDEKVYFADHEAGPHPTENLEECVSSDSLQEYMAEALELAREVEEEFRQREERKNKKKWWEIWK